MPQSIIEATTTESGLRTNQEAFLHAFSECGSITTACQRTGISRQSPYDWLWAEGFRSTEVDDAPSGTFAYAFLQAKRIAAENVLGRMHEQALSQSESMPTAVQRMFIVKRWMPEYRDQLNVQHSGTTVNVNVDLAAMPPADRARLFELAALHERQKLLDHPVSPEDCAPDPPLA